MEINKENTIEIGKTDNGWILVEHVYLSDDERTGRKIYGKDVTVFEHNDDEEKEREKFKELVYAIAERFCGWDYNKYGRENFEFRWDKKGHKIDDEEDVDKND